MKKVGVILLVILFSFLLVTAQEETETKTVEIEEIIEERFRVIKKRDTLWRIAEEEFLGGERFNNLDDSNKKLKKINLTQSEIEWVKKFFNK